MVADTQRRVQLLQEQRALQRANLDLLRERATMEERLNVQEKATQALRAHINATGAGRAWDPTPRGAALLQVISGVSTGEQKRGGVGAAEMASKRGWGRGRVRSTEKTRGFARTSRRCCGGCGGCTRRWTSRRAAWRRANMGKPFGGPRHPLVATAMTLMRTSWTTTTTTMGRGVGREVAAGGWAATNVGWAVPLAATLTATLTGVAAVV